MNISFPLNDVRTPNKHNKLVISPSFVKGEFDSHGADCPFLFSHNGSYYMTYVGWDSIGYRTGLAVSEDLHRWKKLGMIIDRGPAGSPTEYNVAMTSILRKNELFSKGELIKVNGMFVGTYHAYPSPGYESGPGVIGLCYSKNLKNWEVGEPVLLPSPDIGWERGGLYKSWLMRNDGVYYLFYNAKNNTDHPWQEETGFAFSEDLKTWEKYPGNPVLKTGSPGSFDERFASDPCVLRHRESWLMFYFGASYDGHARDGVAASTDLKVWIKAEEVLIDVGSEGSIDSKYAHKPAIIYGNDRLYHFYCAVSPTGTFKSGNVEAEEIRGISFATD